MATGCIAAISCGEVNEEISAAAAQLGEFSQVLVGKVGNFPLSKLLRFVVPHMEISASEKPKSESTQPKSKSSNVE